MVLRVSAVGTFSGQSLLQDLSVNLGGSQSAPVMLLPLAGRGYGPDSAVLTLDIRPHRAHTSIDI